MSPHINPNDLPPRYRAQLAAQLGRPVTPHEAQVHALRTVTTKVVPNPTTDEAQQNSWERAWGQQLAKDPTVVWMGPQCVTLKLAHDCRYTPDWWVVRTDGRVCAYEVKGFARDDAMVKLRVAARAFAWVSFWFVTRSGQQWAAKEVKP